VTSALVDLELRKATVTFDAEVTEVSRLIQAIEDAGFDAVYPLTGGGGSAAVATGRTIAPVEELLEVVELRPSIQAEHVRTTHLEVLGMTCGSCVASIEKHLHKQPGLVQKTPMSFYQFQY